MSEETKIGTQTLDSSSKTKQLRFRQEPEMDTLGIETSTIELKLRSDGERIKQTTDSILRRAEERNMYFISESDRNGIHWKQWRIRFEA